MKSNATAFLGLVSLACMSVFSATAIGADTRVMVTDPNVLESMGFPANATNVYRASVPATGVSDVQQAADFGTMVQYTALAPKAFIGRQNTAASPWQYDGGDEGCCQNLSRKGNEIFADAPVNLPNGALLNGVRFWANDSSVAGNLEFFMFESCYPAFGPGATNTNTILALGELTTSGSSGNQSDFTNLPATTIDNQGCVYTFRARFEDTAGLTLQKIRFQWYRQISPAPGVASFTDVPTNAQFFQEVEALANSGITSGCTATTFCPDNFVTRRQMAAFLSRALGL